MGTVKRKKTKENVLAYGEVTGHAHRVDVDAFEGSDNLLEFEGATTITHEEHKALEIPVGEWVSGRVMEFDHLENQLIVVND